VYLVIPALLAVAVLAFLVLAYRVLKAAHTRPQGASAAHPAESASHSHSWPEKAVLFVVSRAFRLMLRLGIRLGPMMMLTVRGRKSGVPRTNPVDLFERDGRHWLVATHDANASWVRNLRAASEGTLSRGRRRYVFTAAELPQAEAGIVLKEVLGPRLARPAAGFVLRQTIGVPPDAPVESFIDAAATHPVFALAVSRESKNGAAPKGRPGSLVGK
jgi:deazaflavin-dependent oxidoreductase (nitroreductase family)